MKNDTTEYEMYEMQSKSAYNRRCIDGRIVGCGNCVGYCKYVEHPGFLTEKLRESHNCIGKGCDYYVEREKTKILKTEKHQIEPKSILPLVQKYICENDDIKLLNSRYEDDHCIIDYVSVFGCLKIASIEKSISENVGYPVKMNRLNFSFDRSVELLLKRGELK